MRLRRNERGFTLIEILVVIAVVAILAAGIAPLILGVIDRGKVSRMVGDVQQFKTAIRRFQVDTGFLPDNTAACAADPGLVQTPNALGLTPLPDPTLWRGPYLEAFKDTNPWVTAGAVVGCAYQYIATPPSAAADNCGVAAWDTLPATGGTFGYPSCVATCAPANFLADIDAQLDDGNAATGTFRGFGLTARCGAAGPLVEARFFITEGPTITP